jgi:hypothetical protein
MPVIWMLLFAPVTRPRGVTFMSRCTLTRLTDSTLLRDLESLVSQERSTTALLVAHLAEVDARRLNAPAGYPSLFNYCVEELHFSEESACRRIRAARVAREYPAVFDSDGDAQVAPLAPQRFAVQFTMDQEAHDDLLCAQALLGHSLPNGDPAQVIARALKTLIARLEQQKFAKAARPRPCRASDNARHVPADVKRTVWERDGGQCTFVGESGHRCEARTRLEFDHVEPVAQGGRATVQGLRLRCRAHNQYAAEQSFGRDFMNTKRDSGTKQPLPEHALEVIPWLHSLGFQAEEARKLAERCEEMPDTPLEERLRHALKCSARPQHNRVA